MFRRNRYIGGPLALVKTGDVISLDVAARTLDLEISDEEFARRRAASAHRPSRATSAATAGCSRATSTQADQGCDFDFLQTDFGAPVKEPDIF